MGFDLDNRLSASQAISVDAYSTNVIDLTQARKIGIGEPLGIGLFIEVAADFTTGNETYTFEIHTDDNAAMSSGTKIFEVTYTAAELTAGAFKYLPLPQDKTYERYLALYYNVGGTTPTVTVSAYLGPRSVFSQWEALPGAGPYA